VAKFKRRPSEPASDNVKPAFRILTAAFDTADSFIDIYDRFRKSRRASGAPTDEEQDLLRAMVVFAGAGLDSAVKQLASDGLLAATQRDLGANEQLKTFVQRRLGRSAVDRDVDLGDERPAAVRALDLDAKYLSALLLSSSAPRGGRHRPDRHNPRPQLAVTRADLERRWTFRYRRKVSLRGSHGIVQSV
jgi:hypothetical protein